MIIIIVIVLHSPVLSCNSLCHFKNASKGPGGGGGGGEGWSAFTEK